MTKIIMPVRAANPAATFDFSDCIIRTKRDFCSLAPFEAAVKAPSLIVDPSVSSIASDSQFSAFMRNNGVPSNGTVDHARPHGPVFTSIYSSEAVALQKPKEWSLDMRYPGTFKEFKEAQARGDIVLKPMTRFKAIMSDIPVPVNFRSQRSFVSRSGFNSYQQACSVAGSMSGGYPTEVRRGTGRYPDLHGLWYASFVYELGECDKLDSSFLRNGYPDLSLVPFHARATPQIGNLINEALDENFSGLYDLLTELGELPTTLAYVYSILRRIIQLFLGLKSKEAAARKKFSGKELIDEIASLWMQFRYAVSPLAYSAQDILELIGSKKRTYVTTRKREDQEFSWDVDGFTLTGIIEHRCFVKSRVNPNANVANIGLNPLKTLWELTPLSFVIDWVLPIGQMLGGLLPPSNATQVAASYSMRIRDLKVSGPVSYPVQCDYYHVTLIQPRPTSFSPDLFLNWKRVIDSMALGWGLFLKQHWKS